MEDLFRQVGIDAASYFPFHQEVDPEKPISGWLTHLIPPTRLVYKFSEHTKGST